MPSAAARRQIENTQTIQITLCNVPTEQNDWQCVLAANETFSRCSANASSV